MYAIAHNGVYFYPLFFFFYMPQQPQGTVNGTYLIEGQGAQTTNLLNFTSVMKQIVNEGLPIVHVFPFKFACFSYLLFEIEEYFQDVDGVSMRELQLRVKNLGNGKYNLVMTNDDCGIEWREEIHTFDYTTVTAPVSNSTTVVVADVKSLKGIGASTKIKFHTTATVAGIQDPVDIVAIVASVNEGTNTITLANAVTLKAGDKVFRGANLRVSCQEIDNTYSMNKRGKYVSYFRSIQAHIDFDMCELAKDREVFSLKGNGTPQLLVDAKVSAVFENLLKVDFLDAFLYDTNEKEDKTANIAGQTRGLLTSLQDAQTTTGTKYIFNAQPLVGTTNDEAVITFLIDIFIRAFDSGFYNSEPITAIINAAQLKHLMFMAPSFEEYFGIQMYKEVASSHEGCRDYVSLRVHGIEIEHGVVEFVLFEPLSHYRKDTPVMMLVPKSMYGMYQRRYTKLDGQMRVQSSAEENAYPKFRFTDISPIKYYQSGGDECYTYITKLRLGLAMAGVYNNAYYFLKNVKSYKTYAAGAVDQAWSLAIANY